MKGQQKHLDAASSREKVACPDCPLKKNQHEMGLQRLVELSTMSYGSTRGEAFLCLVYGLWLNRRAELGKAPEDDLCSVLAPS